MHFSLPLSMGAWQETARATAQVPERCPHDMLIKRQHNRKVFFGERGVLFWYGRYF